MYVWARARMFPPTMVTIASAQIMPNHFGLTFPRAMLNTRKKAGKTAALVATDMKAVTGVGAPSYTSGVHMWNGTTETLNAKPTIIRAMPTSRKGLVTTAPEQVEPPTQVTIRLRLVDPVAPYTSAMP